MTEKRNVVLWAMIGIPTAAVLASLYTMYLAYSGAEPKLPARYVSEGSALDADFARSAVAQAAGVIVELQFLPNGDVVAEISADDPSVLPPSLTLELTHATLPQQDRSITLQRATTERYTGSTPPLPAGRWHGELVSDEWRLRARLDSSASQRMIFGR